jgi:3-methyladenine DNA glycosylase AlkC
MDELKHWFDRAFYTELAALLNAELPTLDRKAFIRDCCHNLNDRSLKERLLHTTQTVHNFLPGDLKHDLRILKPLAPKISNTFCGMFLPEYVELYGLHDFKTSMSALKYFTRYSSSEFAIRVFLRQDTKKTMNVMSNWATDENHHVRRLASEGCRPRLPWSFQLPEFIDNPEPLFPILNALKCDASLYVRKSVANNLNDISKDNPERMLALVEKWDPANTHTAWIIKHAARTLIKQGNVRSLSLFGFTKNPKIAVSTLHLSAKSLSLENDLTVSFSISSRAKKTQRLAVDYAVHYMKKNGKTSPKVFKLKELDLTPGQTIDISKKHAFKNFSTRTHYAGIHNIEILINGTPHGNATFKLKI